jgi:uncharacterized membrane protein YwzB
MQQQGLDSYIKRENLGELLAKWVAKDGFSFHVVTNSSAIWEFINKRGYTMPNIVNTVITLVLHFFDKKSKNYQNYYNKTQAKQKKICIIVDGWTENTVTRFLNVTLNSEKKSLKVELVKFNVYFVSS